MKRPGQYDAAVVVRHMAAIRDQVKDCLLRDEQVRADMEGGDPGPDMDEVMQDVARAMEFESDGYRVVRNLEFSHSGAHNWRCDSDLVDVMEMLVRERHSAYEDVVSEWVKSEGITPQFAVGDLVRVTLHGRTAEQHDGEIATVSASQATYVVRIPALGHVRAGVGTHGRVVPFEDVQARTAEAVAG